MKKIGVLAFSFMMMGFGGTMLGIAAEKPTSVPQSVTESPRPDAVEEAAPADASSGVNDPLEPVNRVLFFINRALDGAFLKPTAIIYRTVVPPPVRDGVSNFLNNTLTPLFAANHMLQARPDKAVNEVARFIVNTTLGICGLFDIAKEFGLPAEPTWFEETLYVWGVDTGPYLMLPFFGPSTFRGAFGMVGDYFLEPINYYYNSEAHDHQNYLLTVRTGARALRDRAAIFDESGNDGLEALEKSSADYYAAVRSVYLQRLTYREQQLNTPRGQEVNREVVEAKGLPKVVHPASHDEKKNVTTTNGVSKVAGK